MLPVLNSGLQTLPSLAVSFSTLPGANQCLGTQPLHYESLSALLNTIPVRSTDECQSTPPKYTKEVLILA
jgi:hypothetical protein